MSINVVIVLTAAAGGDEAVAIFNTTVGNFAGIFLSPLLMLLYLGKSGGVSLGQVFFKLTVRVLVPLVIGMAVRKFATERWPIVGNALVTHKKRFKRMQEYCLVFIVYTTFCTTFQTGMDLQPHDIVVAVVAQFSFIVFLMGVAWISLKYLGFSANSPHLRVAGLFGCTSKTVALGVPIINSIYENHPQKGLYTLPVLMWYILHLVLGSNVVPWLSRFIDREEATVQDKSSDNPKEESLPTPVAMGDEHEATGPVNNGKVTDIEGTAFAV